tara:strand:- start:311 stop:505 length:195 start_codon:yes stop_codon:yes gene_type:complete
MSKGKSGGSDGGIGSIKKKTPVKKTAKEVRGKQNKSRSSSRSGKKVAKKSRTREELLIFGTKKY